MLDKDTLVVKGTRYTVNDIDKLPEDINSFRATSKTTPSATGFFGELNLFSNFHKSTFKLDGNSFHSSEQYIQYTKAKYFGDENIASRILETSTPIACKWLANEIEDYNHSAWAENAKELSSWN